MENFKAITLEDRFRELAEKNESIDSLYRSYQVLKEELKKYLPAIFAYYPHYSAHESSHSQSLISAIELILGERRIRALSPADVWLIVVSAQLHDVGMIIPNEEIAKIATNLDFKKFLNEMKQSLDIDFSRAATLLLERKISDDDNTWFLNIKQSVVLLVAEYLRRQHAKRSDNIVSGDTTISRLLSLKLNGETSRAFATVGKICVTHGLDFDRIFTLYETDSISNFRCHPRFVAALIRLGDLCDVDNGRFNAALMAVFGRLPQSSLVHYYKHKTITRLCISEREICMSADIPFEAIKNELELDAIYRIINKEDFCHKIVYEHQRWFNMIETELQNLMLHAGKIFPTDMDQSMPTFQQEILVNGQRSVFSSSNMRLNFAPEKAYALIEGLSLYDEQRTFVREIVQNSLDAMKLQLWHDLKDGRWHAYLPDDKKDELSTLQPFDLSKEIYEYYCVDVNTYTNTDTGCEKITFRDNGIGISYEDLQNNIVKTGTSWNSRSEYESDLRSMPRWMRPTGGFGIGLHAAFAVTDRIEIKSKTQYETHPKHIIIHSGQHDGFVFSRRIEEKFNCGTETVIEIDKKLSDIQARSHQFTPYKSQPSDEFAFFIEEYMKETIICPLFLIRLNGKAIGETLCTSKSYGAVFDSKRRDKFDGVFLAVTDDAPMQYVVWDPVEGVFYNLLPKSEERSLETVCSFKGIFLSKSKISFYYHDFFHLKAMECLSADSKIVIRADRREFLTDYALEISKKSKKVCKALVLEGEKKFGEQMKHPIGILTTLEFLDLCDKIAQFSTEDIVIISEKREVLLAKFVKAVEIESDTNKWVYLLYLAFATLRYFVAGTNQIWREYSAINSRSKAHVVQRMLEYLKSNFQFVPNTFPNLYGKLGNVFGGVFGGKLGRAFARAFGGEFVREFGREFVREFGREFGTAFGRAFGSKFGSPFVSEFISEFSRAFGRGIGSEFGKEFVSEFGSEFGSAFGTEFGREFGSPFLREFVSTFGNCILINQWEWIIWIGYCENLSQGCADSIYFKSIPAFNFNFHIEGAKTLFDIIHRQELSILYMNCNKISNTFPLFNYLYVSELYQKRNELYCSLVIKDDNLKTIADTSEFSLYYKKLAKGQRNVFCPQKYASLGVNCHNIPYLNDQSIYFSSNLYIFLPTRISATSFFDYIVENKQSGVEAIVDAVLQAEETVNIIQYTYLHRQNKIDTHAIIFADYRRFLTEFVIVRLENN